jgi:cell division protein FtsX
MNILLKVQAILQDGSVALEFKTNEASEAEEIRRQILAVEGVAKVRVLDQPGWELM